MGKSAGSPPKAPDPVATANAQAAANRETAITQAQLNNVDQITPFGSLTFEQTGEGSDGTPTFTATTTLSPEQQNLLDLSNQAATTFGETANAQLGQLQGTLSSPLDFGVFGDAPVANEATRQATRDAIVARAQPDFDRQRQQLETRLVNQGFEMGSEGFRDAFNSFDDAQNDFRLGADAAAGNEMSRIFALERAARDANINELLQQRSQPLNELAAMLSGSQVTAPSFVGTPQTGVAPTDVTGATFGAFNAAQNNFNQQQANDRALNQGLFGIGGSALSAVPLFFTSDEHLKRDVTRIGERNGLGLYRFRYLWSPVWYIGHMAQEVIKVRPDAVREVNGYLAVNYGALA